MKFSSFCLNIRCFAGWIGCLLFSEMVGSVYFRSIISTIERRFALPSTVTALLSTSFQIGSMPMLVLVSYFGSRYHRPRTIAIGALFMAVGFFMMFLPQLFGGRYEFLDISSNKSVTSLENMLPTTCQASPKNVTCEEDNDAGENGNLYLFFLIGMILCGMGSTPVQPLGISYIDDHSSKHNAALYIGVVTSIGLAAPAAGFLLGSFTLKSWVDIGWVDTDDIKITPRHPGWVGAWWIGFIITSILIVITGLPMWFYPQRLPKNEEKNENTEDTALSARVSPSLKADSGNIFTAIKRLATNRRYVVIVLIAIFGMFRIGGVTTFMLKYYEVVFGRSASSGSFIVGAINLPALVLGTFIGSFIVKKWKLDSLGITRLTIFSMIGSTLLTITLLFLGCETQPNAGLNTPYPNNGSNLLSLTSSCNINCGCDDHVYTPVCGPNNITYVTPCHAGCLDYVGENGTIYNYTKCSCVDQFGINGTVTIGRCQMSDYCQNLVWTFAALNTFSSFFGGLHATPLFLLMIRALNPVDKAFGIGMAFFLYRLLGFIPSPIIYGYFIDQSCLQWAKKPCGNRFYCTVYDNKQYRLTFYGISFFLQLLSLATTFYYYVKFSRYDEETELHENVEEKPYMKEDYCDKLSSPSQEHLKLKEKILRESTI